MKLPRTIGLSLLGKLSFYAFAQEFDDNLQPRPLYGYRNRFKTLTTNGKTTTFLLSKHSHFNFNFMQEKLKFELTLQNITLFKKTLKSMEDIIECLEQPLKKDLKQETMASTNNCAWIIGSFNPRIFTLK